MRSFSLGAIAVLVSLVLPARAGSPGDRSPGVSVTVYRSGAAAGLAQVSDRRTIDLVAGENEVRFEGVAGQLDPGSVLVRDLDDGEARVLEQGFRWDMASADALLARYLGEPVIVVTASGEKRGRLRAFDAGEIVLESDDPAAPAQIVSRGKDLVEVRFGSTQGMALASRPTLVFRIVTRKPGPHLIEASYQTGGLSWSADYNVIVGADGKKVELSGWLGIVNASKASFKDARWQVVAGDILRPDERPVGQPAVDPYTGLPITPSLAAPPRLHRYALPVRASLASGQTRQFELFPTRREVGGKLVLVHEHVPAYAHAYRQQGYPTFDQSADGTGAKKIDQLGEFLELEIAAGPDGLPAGRLRVHRQDRTGAPALVAEDSVEHSAGTLRVRVGGTTEVTGERKQADYRLDERARELREKFDIRLRNSRGVAVEVRVVEHLFRWRTWSIEGESAPYERSDDGQRAVFRVKVPARGEATLTYTARYTSW